MLENNDDLTDGWGCRNALREALADERLRELACVTPESASQSSFVPSPGAQQAACLVAEALGYCRLFGVALGDMEGPLPVAAAIAAALQLHDDLTVAIACCEALASGWYESETYEHTDTCASLLEIRMDAWAIFYAICESHSVCLERTGYDSDRLLDALLKLIEQTNAFDDALLAEADLLATVVDLPLLDNWRNFLADEFRSKLPWWLDGTLERIADQTEQTAMALLPDVDTARRRLTATSWKQFVNRAKAGLRQVWSGTQSGWTEMERGIDAVVARPASKTLVAAVQLPSFSFSVSWFRAQPRQIAMLTIESDPPEDGMLHLRFYEADGYTELKLQPATKVRLANQILDACTGEYVAFPWKELFGPLELEVDGEVWQPSLPE